MINMALADFNKSNPFVIQMRYESDRLNSVVLNLSKKLIILMIAYIPTAILSYFALKWRFFEILYLTAPLVITSLAFYYVIKHSDNKRINDILYGNEYKDIFVNNEELFKINCNLRELIGRVSILQEIIIMHIIIYILISIISILTLFARIIHF